MTERTAPQFLPVKVGGQDFSIAVAQIKEVIPITEISPIPGAHELILGLVYHREEMVTVYDVAQLKGLVAKQPSHLVIGFNDQAVAVESIGTFSPRHQNVICLKALLEEAPCYTS